MNQDNSTVKVMTKAHFERVKDNFKSVDESVEEELEGAQDSDVVALSMVEGSAFSVTDAQMVSEGNEDEFMGLMKDGF